MPRRARREAAIAWSATADELDKISELILALRQQKQQEAAVGRAEGREERQIQMQEREAVREEGAVRRTAAQTEAMIGSPITQDVMKGFGKTATELHGPESGKTAIGLAQQGLGAMQSPEKVQEYLRQLYGESTAMRKTLGERLSKLTEEEEWQSWVDELRKTSPVAAKRLDALNKGMDVKTAQQTFPFPEETAEPKDEVTELQRLIISLLTKINPDTQMVYTDDDVIRMLRLTPEQAMKYFGRQLGERGTMATAALSSIPAYEAPPAESTAVPAPTKQTAPPIGGIEAEQYNVADHIPAGEAAIDIDGSIDAMIEQTGITRMEDIDIKGMANALGITTAQLIEKLKVRLGEE